MSNEEPSYLGDGGYEPAPATLDGDRADAHEWCDEERSDDEEAHPVTASAGRWPSTRRRRRGA